MLAMEAPLIAALNATSPALVSPFRWAIKASLRIRGDSAVWASLCRNLCCAPGAAKVVRTVSNPLPVLLAMKPAISPIPNWAANGTAPVAAPTSCPVNNALPASPATDSGKTFCATFEANVRGSAASLATPPPAVPTRPAAFPAT